MLELGRGCNQDNETITTRFLKTKLGPSLLKQHPSLLLIKSIYNRISTKSQTPTILTNRLDPKQSGIPETSSAMATPENNSKGMKLLLEHGFEYAWHLQAVA